MSIIMENENMVVKNKPEEKMIKNITLTFEDGTTQQIDKGMVITLAPKEDDEMELHMECCNINGIDMENTMYGLLQAAAQFINLD